MARKKLQARPRSGLARMKGFTLVELITTMILIGVLSVVAIPRIGAFSDSRGPVHAAELRANLAYARMTAVAARRYVCVAVSSDSLVTFTMDPADPDAVSAPTCSTSNPVPLPGGDQTGVLRPPDNVTVALSLSNSAPTPGSFYFSPAGVSSSNASLTAGGVTITVNAITGGVS